MPDFWTEQFPPFPDRDNGIPPCYSSVEYATPFSQALYLVECDVAAVLPGTHYHEAAFLLKLTFFFKLLTTAFFSI